MTAFVLTIYLLINAGFVCNVQPGLALCTNAQTQAWVFIKANPNGSILKTNGLTS